MKAQVFVCDPWDNHHPLFDEIVALDEKLISQFWTKNQWATSHNLLVMALNTPQLVGFAAYQILPADDLAHLLKIAILESFRASDESRYFWEEQLKTLRTKGIKRVYLEVEVKNYRAVGFYKKNGFKILHTAKSFYLNGEDAHKMELAI